MPPAKKTTKPAPRVKTPPRDVDSYQARVPPSARGNFIQLRATIRSAVPSGASETISYGIPAITQGGVVVWFAAFANHCSLFPTAAVVAEFKNELKNLRTSKGTIHFPNDKPLPVTLIRKMVKARVAQLEKKKAGK